VIRALMMLRVWALVARCLNFGKWRRVLVTESRGWSLKGQLVAAAAVFCISAWLTVTTVSYLGTRNLVSSTAQVVGTLEHAYADLLSDSQHSTATFVEQIEQLEATGEQQRQAIAELSRLRGILHRQLASRERQLATVTEQRDRAREEADQLKQRAIGTANQLDSVAQKREVLSQERAALAGQLAMLQSRLTEVNQQWQAGQRIEVGLRSQVSRLQDEIARLQADREIAQVWFNDWVLGSLEAIEHLFDSTGIDLERLVARATGPDMGQGGPLRVANIDPIATSPLPSPYDGSISGSIHHLAALQRLVRRLPLASPMDHFTITSIFGERRDPFTQDWAFHAGLDFGAARGAKVRATAPGRIVYAGPAGAYGNMVELDHGMGITTRYGHLKSIAVEVGDAIEFRQVIGVVGTSGRSTGRHLHYEIRLDDVAYDPAKFMEAGRSLVGVFVDRLSASFTMPRLTAYR
jgi:murein DD-endopeptidase MepM/ murein hydrolase activator NlpD